MKDNEKFYADFVMPCVQNVMNGEQAHNFAIKMAKYGLVPNKVPLKNEECLVSFHLNLQIKIFLLMIYFKAYKSF